MIKTDRACSRLSTDLTNVVGRFFSNISDEDLIKYIFIYRKVEVQRDDIARLSHQGSGVN